MVFLSRKNLFVTLAVTLMSTMPMAAWAFIPPSQFIIKGMTAKRSGLKSARIQAVVYRLDAAGKPTEHRFKETTSYDAATRVLRSIATDDSGRELYRLERKLQSTAANHPMGEKVDELLLALYPEGLTGSLVRLGLPIRSDADLMTLKNEEERRQAEGTQLLRWKSTFAWVIGRPSARNPERPVSQLWVEKDSFLPLRLILPSSANSSGGKLEWSFESYRYFREIPFPRQVTWLQEDRPRIRVETQDVQVNGPLPELKVPEFVTGFTEAGNEASSGVRDLIQSHYEWIR